MALHRFSPERLALGVAFVGVGVLGVLAQLGRVDFLDELHTWWPASLLVWGLAELFYTFLMRGSSR